MRPPELQGVNLVPSTDSMLERLSQVETELTSIEAELHTDLDARQRAGAVAHRAALLRRKQWYLARIRTVRPIQALETQVADAVSTKEAHG